MKRKETVIKLFTEILSRYKNDIGTRGVDLLTGACQYLSKDGNNCAIGQCMNRAAIKRYGTFTGPVSILARKLGRQPFDSILKTKYHGITMAAWESLQSIHDSSPYWASDGITDRGETAIKKLFASF